MAERNFALVAIDQDRLCVEQRFVASRGIPRVADRGVARKRAQDIRGKNLLDFAHRAVQMQVAAIARNNPGGFLPAMLQRVQAEIRELRRFLVPENPEHTTFVVETVVSESELLRQRCDRIANF